MDGYLKVQVIHYDGSTETVIGTQVQTATLVNAGNTDPSETRTTILFAVDRRFKRGEILRVNIEHWVKSANVNGFMGTYHDPENTEDADVDFDTTLIAEIPFEVR